MIFDELGLPRDNGASDLQDSARLAGLCAVFNFDLTQNMIIPLQKYVAYSIPLSNGRMVVRIVGNATVKTYVRHPKEYKYDFSRDQAICLMAGLFNRNQSELVNLHFVNGKDWFSPSHMGHVRMCRGEKPRWYERAWLWLDVLYGCFYQPMGEPNQLLCMLMVADPKYLKFWLKYNKYWRDAIREYWCERAGEWRGERELAEHMIKVLERLA